MSRFLVLALSGCIVCGSSGCSGGSQPPPPPPQNQLTPPPGQVFVTVSANSTPPGATVTGGGRLLGSTPFTAQVPVPAPQPGQTQTFQFTFQLPGYQPTTMSASPINNTITLNAALGSAAANGTGNNAQNGGGDDDSGDEGGGTSFTARGANGGPITDNHITTSTIRVEQDCVIATARVDINGNHSYFSDLIVSVRGPDGHVYPLQSHESRNPFRTHRLPRAAGLHSAGTWTVVVNDTVGQDNGQLGAPTLTIRCR